MKIEREHLLKVLTIASIGLTKRESIEQSNCYLFDGEHLITYNSEILTRTTNPLEGVQGAVPAEEFHKILAKFPDAEVDVSIEKGELRIKGKRRTAGITMHAEVSEQHKDVPKPKEWNDAPEKLSGVLLQAARCCGKDETMPDTTVVHIAPDKVESHDNKRLFRYTMETGFVKDALIPSTSLESLGGLSIEKICQRKGWAHLLMPDDHVVSVRCVAGEYPDLGPQLKLKDAQKITLPSNLDDILSRAEIMQDRAFDASVSIEIDDGVLKLTARKEGGWYRETKKVDYDGIPLRFSVHPDYLKDFFAKKKSVLVAGNRMKLKIKEAVLVICLEVRKEEKE